VKNLSSSFATSFGMTAAKLATHFYPPRSTSSPSICSALIPADGDVAEDIMTLLMPVMWQTIYSGKVLAPTVAAPRSYMIWMSAGLS